MARPTEQHEQTVLLIDDAREMREVLTLLLARTGVKTASCRTGTEGIQNIERSAFSLVVLDFRLPDLSAEEILSRILVIRPKQKVLILTGIIPDGSFESKMRSLGAVGCLEKSGSIKIIVETIQKLLLLLLVIV